MSGCPLCGVGPEDKCAADCPSRNGPAPIAGRVAELEAALADARAERDALAVQLRRRGLSYRQVALIVGITHTAVRSLETGRS